MDNNNNNRVMIAIMLYLLSVSLMAQTGFMKSYHIEGVSTTTGFDILNYSDSYLITSIPVSLSGSIAYTGIIKTDTNGTKQWDNLFTNGDRHFAMTPNVNELSDNGWLICGEMGHIENYGSVFFLKVNNQGDSLLLSEYGNADVRVGSIHTTIRNDTIFAILRYGDIPNTYSNLMLLKMDTCLTILAEIPLEGVSGYPINRATFITPAEEYPFLYLSIGHNLLPAPPSYMSVRKIDLQGNTIWEYPLNTYMDGQASPQIIILPNNNVIVYWFDEGAGGSNSERNPYLICLSPAGQFIWRYNFNDNAYKKFPVAITKAANGDIIGCGYTNNPNYIYDCGWLFRISPNGELLWEREYISSSSGIFYMNIYGVDEHENDNITATGLVIETFPNGGGRGDALLLKVLPNGCFTPNCNGGAEDTLIVASTVVGVESVSKPPQASGGGQLAIFPNPTNDVLQILLPNQRDNAQIHITNLLGSTLKTVPLPPHYNQQYFSIATHDLPNGMYLVSYIVAGKQAITAKLLIFH